MGCDDTIVYICQNSLHFMSKKVNFIACKFYLNQPDLEMNLKADERGLKELV